ncbi:hypothetical protein C1H46_034571 [Malus baccata]|uniref:Elongation factor Ts, mitochondrial n=1 Tax=Malus baccata TaxID=106549 RepID=A0A540L048_MALBA|nr:hypothetical protein C1H46_034571 [Malus baccata]
MAAEGLLALAQNENKAVIIELNCETDFVARYLSILVFGVGGFCSVGFFSNNSKGRKYCHCSLASPTRQQGYAEIIIDGGFFFLISFT